MYQISHKYIFCRRPNPGPNLVILLAGLTPGVFMICWKCVLWLGTYLEEIIKKCNLQTRMIKKQFVFQRQENMYKEKQKAQKGFAENDWEKEKQRKR